ncbi:MAG: hypothetical protein GTO18_05935 [Anaerolineales bacterium]|nr:hypothetical protein [Anaerolineales bacterium]
MDIPPGSHVRILSIEGTTADKRNRLLAFGVTPGSYVEVKQHRPVTVIQVDFTELALEEDVASQIQVDRVFHGKHHARRGFRFRRGGERRHRRRWRLLRRKRHRR